jgi:hypothetical protein
MTTSQKFCQPGRARLTLKTHCLFEIQICPVLSSAGPGHPTWATLMEGAAWRPPAWGHQGLESPPRRALGNHSTQGCGDQAQVLLEA